MAVRNIVRSSKVGPARCIPCCTVLISSASASGISIANSCNEKEQVKEQIMEYDKGPTSSTAMTTSTASRLSSPKSSANDDVRVSLNECVSSEKCNQMWILAPPLMHSLSRIPSTRQEFAFRYFPWSGRLRLRNLLAREWKVECVVLPTLDEDGQGCGLPGERKT